MERMVTDLKQIGKSDKYRLFLDYNYYCELELEIIYKYHIKDGLLINDELLDEIKYENQKLTCYSVALGYVSKALKTEKQVSDYLIKKEYMPEIVDLALKKLKNYGYINDELYANSYFSTYKNQKGVRLIKKELENKGINREVLDAVFSDASDDLININQIINKKLKNCNFPLDLKQKQKLVRFLISKGFDYSLIKHALNSYGECGFDEE